MRNNPAPTITVITLCGTIKPEIKINSKPMIISDIAVLKAFVLPTHLIKRGKVSKPIISQRIIALKIANKCSALTTYLK